MGRNSNAVKITLRPGQTLRHSYGGRTDEGYNWTAEAWTLEDGAVVCNWHNDARDCDGRYSRGGVSYCSLDSLRAGWRDDADGVAYPAWKDEDEYQRDFTAEAMGY